MTTGAALNASWGLADDVLADLDRQSSTIKYLLALVEDQIVAVPEKDVLVVLDGPKVSGWLVQPHLVGVFSLRGDVYVLTDPADLGRRRPVAIVLERAGRFVAVGCDRMLGVEVAGRDVWRDLEGAEWPWAHRLWEREEDTIVLLEADVYLRILEDSTGKESPR